MVNTQAKLDSIDEKRIQKTKWSQLRYAIRWQVCKVPETVQENCSKVAGAADKAGRSNGTAMLKTTDCHILNEQKD